jgi:hypothetical protein
VNVTLLPEIQMKDNFVKYLMRAIAVIVMTATAGCHTSLGPLSVSTATMRAEEARHQAIMDRFTKGAEGPPREAYIR